VRDGHWHCTQANGQAYTEALDQLADRIGEPIPL
jgi:hypothetical protein